MGLNLNVTHRKLSLDSPADAITGWYAKSYSESTIKMYVEGKGAIRSHLPIGTFVRKNFLGMCVAPVWEGDEIEMPTGEFYEVATVTEVPIADSFSHRNCDLVYLPLHGKTYVTTAPSVDDARYLTKDYLDDYVSDSNLQNYNWLVCYSEPEYPLTRVFSDKNMAIIFTIDTPTTTPDLDTDLEPFAYNEKVPIHIVTLDTELGWLAEQELREVVAAHPLGSQRSIESLTRRIHHLGSTTLYDRTVSLNYTRGTA